MSNVQNSPAEKTRLAPTQFTAWTTKHKRNRRKKIPINQYKVFSVNRRNTFKPEDSIYRMPCIALIPYKCCWCIYLAFCCLHNKVSHQWQHRASSQKSFHSVDGSAAHRGSLFSQREAVTKCWRENGNLKNRSNSGWLKFNLLTRVDDCLPLVELALVWLTVEVTTLDVPERGQVMKTRCGVTDLVPPSLSQTILPSVPRTTEEGTMLFECFCTFFWTSIGSICLWSTEPVDKQWVNLDITKAYTDVLE